MVMQRNQDPSTISECTELIKSCTEMLALASKSIFSKIVTALAIVMPIASKVSYIPDLALTFHFYSRYTVRDLHTKLPSCYHHRRKLSNTD